MIHQWVVIWILVQALETQNLKAHVYHAGSTGFELEAKYKDEGYTNSETNYDIAYSFLLKAIHTCIADITLVIHITHNWQFRCW